MVPPGGSGVSRVMPAMLERDGIRDPVVAAGLDQPGRVVGGDGIEVGRADQTALDELALVPSAAEDPVAGLHGPRAIARKARNVGNALYLREAEVDSREAHQARRRKMHVRIDEARRHGAAGEVDAVGRRAREALDLGRRADREDATVPDRECLGDAVRRIHRQDASVHEDAVGRPLRPYGQAQPSDHDRRRQPLSHGMPPQSGMLAKMAMAASNSARSAWLVLALVAIANFGNFYVYDSIGPVADLLQRERGFSDTQIGWLNAIYSLPNIVLLLVGGWMVDRFGARRMMAATAALCFCGALLTALGTGFAGMAGGRLVFGIGAETFNVTTLAAIVQWFSGRHLAFAIGASLALGRAGAFAVDLSPTWMASAYADGWQPPLLVAALFAGLSLAMALAYWRLDRGRDAGRPARCRTRPRRAQPRTVSARRSGSCSPSACCGTR